MIEVGGGISHPFELTDLIWIHFFQQLLQLPIGISSCCDEFILIVTRSGDCQPIRTKWTIQLAAFA